MKDGTSIINLDEYNNIGNHWIAMYVKTDEVTYFDSFTVIMFQKKLDTS